MLTKLGLAVSILVAVSSASDAATLAQNRRPIHMQWCAEGSYCKRDCWWQDTCSEYVCHASTFLFNRACGSFLDCQHDNCPP
jgi:hypothetical protein